MSVRHGNQVRVLSCVFAAVAVAGTWAGAMAPALAAQPAASWGRGIEVRGLAALDDGGYARVTAVSCASAGNCVAGGHYGNRHGQQGFVVDERHGVWGTAIEVPGLGALNKGGGADVLSVSCGSPGNCAAGGYYSWNPGVPYFRTDGFVATERGGRWSKAVTFPAKDSYGASGVSSVSCAPGSTCLAGGGAAANYYGNDHAFFGKERAGRWGSAWSVPGLRALNSGGSGSWIDSVACPSAGACAVGGAYLDGSGNQHAFVASEDNGAWDLAIQVPGLAALNTGSLAEVNSVACGSAGNCAAGGYYTDGDQHTQGFVAVEQNGVWGTAVEVPGLGALNTGGNAEVSSVSCGSAGSCAAGGYYTADHQRHTRGFVTVELSGTWSTAIQVPGLAALNRGGRSTPVLTVSCAPAGSCAAGGSYSDRSHHQQGFVVSERNGVWARAIEVPGLAALNGGGSAKVSSLSCPAPGSCAAGGFYTDSSGHQLGFVTRAS